MYTQQLTPQHVNKVRSIARQLAREVRADELDSVAAGTTSCCIVEATPDDCDQ
jgi:hypothetical protein